jgi:hypothetical protein
MRCQIRKYSLFILRIKRTDAFFLCMKLDVKIDCIHYYYLYELQMGFYPGQSY